jgi:two-component system chemotaxis response regulator CheB
MEGHDIVVIGASAGGLDPVIRLVAALERGLPLSLFVVFHTPADWTSEYPRILSKAGAYPAAFAHGGETLERGRVLIAPPDRHLILQEREVLVRRGPRENFWRPSIDVLFRSAAVAHGSRVVGVILSGSMDDGAAGLSAIARCNGVALVQDPLEAAVRDMPDSALRVVPEAEAMTVADIARRLQALAYTEPKPALPAGDMLRTEARIAEGDSTAPEEHERHREPTRLTCPDCSGPLSRDRSGIFFRCHVGHAFTERSLAEFTQREIESSLWSAVRLFQQRANLCRSLAQREQEAGRDRSASSYEERARDSDNHAHVLRNLLVGVPSASEA